MADSFCKVGGGATRLEAPGRRLRVQPDGGIIQPDGTPFIGKGVNWGKRLTPTSPDGVGDLYNQTDPLIQLQLFPGSNLVRLVLDYYSGGVCYTDIFDETRPSHGYIAQVGSHPPPLKHQSSDSAPARSP